MSARPFACALAVLLVGLSSAAHAATVFSETFGNPTTDNLTVADAVAANVLDNSEDLQFATTFTPGQQQVRVRLFSGSGTYPGHSQAGHLYLPGGASFTVSGIDTSAFDTSGYTLSFGGFKSTSGSSMSELQVSWSTDGTTFSPLAVPAQPTGSGTQQTSRLISMPNLTLAATTNLRLRFANTGASNFIVRLDDLQLTTGETGGGDDTEPPPGPDPTPGAGPAPGEPNEAGYVWRSVTIGGGGYVTGLVVHPQDGNVIYARTDVGGAYRWDGDALRWIPMLDQFSSGGYYSVDSLNVDPTDTTKTRVYVATGRNSAGRVLRSSERGAPGSWIDTGLPSSVMLHGNGDFRWAGERLSRSIRTSRATRSSARARMAFGRIPRSTHRRRRTRRGRRFPCRKSPRARPPAARVTVRIRSA